MCTDVHFLPAFSLYIFPGKRGRKSSSVHIFRKEKLYLDENCAFGGVCADRGANCAIVRQEAHLAVYPSIVLLEEKSFV